MYSKIKDHLFLLNTVACTCNTNAQETETEGFLRPAYTT